MGPDPIPGHPTPGMHIWGWMTPVELQWLGERAAVMDSVVEIGSLHGRSAFALLTACDGPVYCVDPWDDDHDLCYGSFLGYCGHFENLRAIRGYSPDATAEIPEVDMTFIDGNHDYEALLADIDALGPKTRRLICGHDYNPDGDASFPGVAKAAHDRYGDRVRCAPETAIWYVDLKEGT